MRTIKGFFGWLYGPPRTPWGLVRWAVVYLGQGLLLALLLAPLPSGVMAATFVVGGVFAMWHTWPLIGRHRCEICRTDIDVLAMFNDQRWTPWRRTRVRWLCPEHWRRDLMLRAWIATNGSGESKDRPGG